MPNIAYPPRRPLSVGEVLDLTFQIYRATVVRCLLFAAVAVILSQAASIYSLAKGGGSANGGLLGFIRTMQGAQNDPLYWVLYVFGLVAPLVFYAAIILRQHAIITARPVGGELSAGLRRLPPLVGIALLIGVSVVACFLPSLLLAPPARYAIMALCLIPASYVVVMVSCALSALVLSGSGALASYARSWRLTSGSFWRLSLIYTVGMVVLLVFYFALGAVAAFMAGLIARGDIALIAASAGVIMVAVYALTTPYYTAMSLAVFGDLSARKEGSDLEQRIAASA